MTRWGELIPHDPDNPNCQCHGCDEDREQAMTETAGQQFIDGLKAAVAEGEDVEFG